MGVLLTGPAIGREGGEALRRSAPATASAFWLGFDGAAG